MPPEAQRLYGRMIEGPRKQTVKIQNERGIEAREVAEAIGTALTAKRPRARYLVGRDARIRSAIERLPDRVRDRVYERVLFRA